MLLTSHHCTFAGVVLLLLQGSTGSPTAGSLEADGHSLYARGLRLQAHEDALLARRAISSPSEGLYTELAARSLLDPALKALVRRAFRLPTSKPSSTPSTSSPSAPSVPKPASDPAKNKQALDELPHIDGSSTKPAAGTPKPPGQSRADRQDQAKADMAKLTDMNGGPHHNWKDSALPGQKKPKGQKATADTERVAHEAMNVPGAGGHDQNNDNWQLRGSPHQTPSAPGQKVVTAQQAKPGAQTSKARHLPVTYPAGQSGPAHLDMSATEHMFDNPNSGKTEVPEPPPRGKPFRRRDLGQLERREALIEALLSRYAEAA